MGFILEFVENCGNLKMKQHQLLYYYTGFEMGHFMHFIKRCVLAWTMMDINKRELHYICDKMGSLAFRLIITKLFKIPRC